MQKHALWWWLLLLAATGCLSPYEGQVVNDQGAAVAGATISVSPADAPATLAPLFDASGARKPNPFTADATGRYSFWAPTGSYNIAITASGFSTTLVNVPVVDRRVAHTAGGSNAQLTLVESSATTTSGNAALAIERLRADGSRVYGPWSLHVDKGPEGRTGDLRWLYNVDWNEAAQTTTGFITADAGLAMTLAPRGPIAAAGATQQYSFSFDYAVPGAAGATPAWTTFFRQDQATVPGFGVLPVARAGTGPFVVGDGLANSSLVARRVGWDTYRTTAPAGVLVPVGDDEPRPSPGDVVVPAPSPFGHAMAARTTQHAEADASVYLRGGNGTSPSLLGAGKALVRMASGAVAGPGDTIVSSGVEPGRGAVDNAVTDSRRIVGFALEAVGDTLPGYLAIVRSSR
jgi:hypothetical protein